MAREYRNLFELFNDWGVRFQSTYYEHTKPMIWVRRKSDKAERLVTGYEEPNIAVVDGERWTLKAMKECWEYLDGSTFGKEE